MYWSVMQQIVDAELIVVEIPPNHCNKRIGLMEQASKIKLFRITYNQTRPSLIKTLKAVHLPIHRPVLEQYNSISLDKTSKYQRIKHKSTALRPGAGEGEAPPHPNNKEWQSTVDGYIRSKKKIQEKKGELDVGFHFHQLDKTNQHRYFRLISEQAIPLASVKLPESIEHSHSFNDPQHRRMRTSMKEENQDAVEYEERQLLTQSTPSTELKQSAAVQEKVIHHFIQNYFKNKYKQERKERQTLRNSFALPRHNTH